MHNLRRIRKHLGITQKALGAGIGCTQGNVYHYEKGQMFPPEMARKLIAFVEGSFDLTLSYDHIYGSSNIPLPLRSLCGDTPLPELVLPAPSAGQEVTHG